MRKLPEPEGVDFTIGEVKPGPNAHEETLRAIEAYKQRPTYQAESEEADRILAAMGLKYRKHGYQEADSGVVEANGVHLTQDHSTADHR